MNHLLGDLVKAKHQLLLQEAERQRLLKDVAKPELGLKFQAARQIERIIRQVGRLVIALGTKLQEKQRPIL